MSMIYDAFAYSSSRLTLRYAHIQSFLREFSSSRGKVLGFRSWALAGVDWMISDSYF